jgi:creatinine amidohydrolase
MNIDELYDPEFRKLIKSKKHTVIIPVGSIEQHGAHLPISTDSDIVTEVALRLAKKCGFIVLPTINYGISFEHSPLFNTSISEDTLKKLLKNILQSLVMNGIRTGIILNGHHGNHKTLDKFVNEWWKYMDSRRAKSDYTEYDFRCKSYSYWHFMKHEFDHAGFVETSIMLAISDKVKMKKAKKGFITNRMNKKELERINKLSMQPGGFAKITKNGVWGDPTGATKKDGQKFLTEIVRNLVKECQS